jgi:hypothetical protein
MIYPLLIGSFLGFAVGLYTGWSYQERINAVVVQDIIKDFNKKRKLNLTTEYINYSIPATPPNSLIDDFDFTDIQYINSD